MEFIADTLDDALLQLYPQLLKAPKVDGATRGSNRELRGVTVEIMKPRARLSRTETRGKPFSALGELLWYLSKDNQLDFIVPFVPAYKTESDDGKTVYGGYGPRLFRQRGQDQIANVLKLLSNRPTTRRALIQIFNAEDLSGHRSEIPCTTTLQFLQRDGKLEMITTMRSNDAYKGLPHDVFCFTMLQEMLARTLSYDIGPYRHFAGSMHLYDDNCDDAVRLTEEGFQSRIEMPSMPNGDPWPSIAHVMSALEEIRSGQAVDASALGLDPYWSDLIRLLQVFAATGNQTAIADLRQAMTSDCYKYYIDSRTNLPMKDRFGGQASS
ncbi:thymidylate synthase [Bradyrhizobium sp. C-145]|uniref:thymidylate synthase n=1 Tax=Bradyrhizobium sp. C-145 TaxID=574727 RepID=UPI00201B7079|nr:thymidylate synthase [Bradyrhizobium sp. C-145]UQR63393.1 thymidylate synthase [Bradyrhizobium sp. C-145]